MYKIDSVSNRNEYQEYFPGGKGNRCVGLKTLPPSCEDCHEIWKLQLPGALRARPGLYMDFFTFHVYKISLTSILSLYSIALCTWVG